MAVQGCRVEEQTWHNRGGGAKGEKSEGSFWEKDCWFGKSEQSVTTGKQCKFNWGWPCSMPTSFSCRHWDYRRGRSISSRNRCRALGDLHPCDSHRSIGTFHHHCCSSSVFEFKLYAPVCSVYRKDTELAYMIKHH